MSDNFNIKEDEPDMLRSKSWEWIGAGIIVGIIGLFAESIIFLLMGTAASLIGCIGLAIAYEDNKHFHV